MSPPKVMRLLLLALFVAVAAAEPEAASRKLLSTTKVAVSAAEKAKILSILNTFRKKYQASALTWSTAVATSAQGSSNTCVFAHNSNQLHTLHYGENLSAASGSANWPLAISLWTSEAKLYNFKKPGFSSATGHFTQVVWRGTKTVGCGYTNCAKQLGMGMYACRFYPAGNVLGQFPTNVKAPLAG